MDYNENIYQLLINNNNNKNIDEPENKQLNIDKSENKKSKLQYNTITLSQTIELLSSCC